MTDIPYLSFELASQFSILYHTCLQNMHEHCSKTACKTSRGRNFASDYSTVVTCTFLILIFSFACVGHNLLCWDLTTSSVLFANVTFS